MTIGIIAAQRRLKARKIFCVSPSTINTCGGINLVVFDKTGTLTEDGLDFLQAIPVQHQKGVRRLLAKQAPCTLIAGSTTVLAHAVQSLRRMADFPDDGALVRAAATCHSLTRIEGEEISINEVIVLKCQKRRRDSRRPARHRSLRRDRMDAD